MHFTKQIFYLKQLNAVMKTLYYPSLSSSHLQKFKSNTRLAAKIKKSYCIGENINNHVINVFHQNLG